MIKRIIKSMLLAATILVVCTTTILAAVAYRASYSVTESDGTDYDMLAAIGEVDNEWLADNGFIEADGLDTRIETYGGIEEPWSVVDDKILTAIEVPADSQTNLYYTTANTDATSYDIIQGYGGRLTVYDDADLELGDDFEIEISGYIDTDAAAGKYLVYKQDAFSCYIDGATNITASIDNLTMYLIPESNGDYTNITNATANHWDDVDDAVGAPDDAVTTVSEPGAAYLGDVYNLTGTGSGVIDTVTIYIRVYTTVGGASAQAILRLAGNETLGTVRTPPGGVWTTYDEALARPGGGSWTATDITALQAGVQLKTTNTASVCTQVYVLVDYHLEVNAINVASGDHVVTTTADGVNFEISVDGAVAGDGYDTAALSGDSVNDNANSWIIMDNHTVDFMPYVDYYTHSVDSGGGLTLIAQYQPNTMIGNTTFSGVADAGGDADTLIDAALTQADDYWNWALVTITETTDHMAPEGETSVCDDFIDVGDDVELETALTAAIDAGDTYTIEFGTLVDREGGDEGGRITWGVNPGGIDVAIGSMVAADQPIPGLEPDSTTRDILPTYHPSDWYGDHTVSGDLLTNPMRPFVTLISDNTSLSEILTWRFLALALILIVTVATLFAVRGHLLIAGIACAAGIIGAVVITVFPIWTLVFAVGAILAGLVAERAPSL